MDINYFIAKYDYKIAEKLNPKNKKKNREGAKGTKQSPSRRSQRAGRGPFAAGALRGPRRCRYHSAI